MIPINSRPPYRSAILLYSNVQSVILHQAAALSHACGGVPPHAMLGLQPLPGSGLIDTPVGIEPTIYCFAGSCLTAWPQGDKHQRRDATLASLSESQGSNLDTPGFNRELFL